MVQRPCIKLASSNDISLYLSLYSNIFLGHSFHRFWLKQVALAFLLIRTCISWDPLFVKSSYPEWVWWTGTTQISDIMLQLHSFSSWEVRATQVKANRRPNRRRAIAQLVASYTCEGVVCNHLLIELYGVAPITALKFGWQALLQVLEARVTS
jgi:hypothetical protein